MAFTSGKVYKLTCVDNLLALDLKIDRDVVEVVTTKYNYKKGQQWLAIRSERGWMLSSQNKKPGDKKYLGLNTDVENTTSYSIEETGFSQQWYATEVQSGVTIYTIVNAANLKALTSHRDGKVTADTPDPSNHGQQWTVQLV